MGKLKCFKVFVIKLKSITIVIVIFLIYVKKSNFFNFCNNNEENPKK